MSTGTTRKLQIRHEKLWADEVVQLIYWLLDVNGICSFQNTDPDTVPKVHCILIRNLLCDWELDEMHIHGTGHSSSLVPVGTLYKVEDA